MCQTVKSVSVFVVVSLRVQWTSPCEERACVCVCVCMLYYYMAPCTSSVYLRERFEHFRVKGFAAVNNTKKKNYENLTLLLVGRGRTHTYTHIAYVLTARSGTPIYDLNAKRIQHVTYIQFCSILTTYFDRTNRVYYAQIRSLIRASHFCKYEVVHDT